MTEAASRPRAALRLALDRAGAGVASDAARCRAFLSDFCRDEHRREVTALCTAVEESIPAGLLASRGTLPSVAAVSAAQRKLCLNRGMSPDVALWAVESWALTLGLCTTAECTSGEALPASPNMGASTMPATVPAPAVTLHRPARLPHRFAAVLVVIAIGVGAVLTMHHAPPAEERPAPVSSGGASNTGVLPATGEITTTAAHPDLPTATPDISVSMPPAIDTAAEAEARQLAELRQVLARAQVEASGALDAGDYDRAEQVVARAIDTTDTKRMALASEREQLALISSHAREMRVEERLRAAERDGERARQAYWEKRAAEVEALLAENKLPEAHTLAQRLETEEGVPAAVSARARSVRDAATARLSAILATTTVHSEKTQSIKTKEKP